MEVEGQRGETTLKSLARAAVLIFLRGLLGAGLADTVKRLREVGGKVLLFSSGHFLRVLGARWRGLEPATIFYVADRKSQCARL